MVRPTSRPLVFFLPYVQVKFILWIYLSRLLFTGHLKVPSYFERTYPAMTSYIQDVYQ